MRSVIITFLLLVSITYSQAQNSRQVAEHWNSWYMYTGIHKLSNKLNIFTDIQVRRSDVIRTWQQLLLRTALEYKVADNIALASGYAFVITYPYGSQPVAFMFNEHRAYEQLSITHKAGGGRFDFTHRYRLEQRWLETLVQGADDKPERTGWNYRNRVRYMLRVNIPLNKAVMEKGALFAGLYDEVFVNFGKNVNLNIFDQNRFYAGLGYRFLKNADVQAGYLNQLIQKANGILVEQNHTLLVTLNYNLDFTAKKE